jgi:hypothetical protein
MEDPMRTTKNLALAAAVLLTLLTGLATPAGASNPLAVRSGTLTTGPLGNFDLTPGSGGGTPPPCPTKPNTMVATTQANGTWTLTGGFSGQFELPAASGSWYQAEFAVLQVVNPTWGAPAPAGTHPLGGTVIVRVEIYQLQFQGGPLTCAKTNLRCRITSAQAIQPGSTYKYASGSGLPATLLGDDITLNTSGTAVTSSCSPPFNAVGGTVVSLTALQAELV